MKRRRLVILPLVALLFALGLVALAEGEPEAVGAASRFYQTFWSLLPPIIAIALPFAIAMMLCALVVLRKILNTSGEEKA